MTDYLLKRPMLSGAVVASVICIGGLYGKTFLLLSGVILILLASILIILKKNAKFLFTLFLLMALTVSFLFMHSDIEQLKIYSGTTAEGRFIVTETPENHGEYNSVTIEVQNSDTLKNGERIYAFYNNNNLECGDVINAEIKINTLENSKYKLNNYSEGVFLSGYINDIKSDEEKYEFVYKKIGAIRKYITTALFDNLSYDEAATLNALVYGDKSFISDSFNNRIKCAGVSHVMVVSGMHLAIIVSLFLGLGEKFAYNRFTKALIIFLTVVFMTALCGFTKSILRSGITYLLMAISIMLNRENNPGNTLGGAVLLILIANPYALFSLSFELSVLSTFGIVVIAIPVIKHIKDLSFIKSKLLKAILSDVIISLAAMLCTLPLTIIYFGYVSTVAVFTNLLISLAVTAALSVAVIALIINYIFAPLSKPLFLIAEIITKYINYVINKLGGLSISTVDVGNWTAYIAIVLTVFIIAFLLACKKRNDMIKLKLIDKKVIKEGGGKLKWQ